MTAKASILVVDDEPAIRDLLSRWLLGEGYWCETASSSEEATRMLEHGRFDLVLSDIRMPGKTGIELLEEARQKERDIAFIMVTALGDLPTASATLKKGAYGYIVKPFDKAQILMAVFGALQRRKLEIENRRHQERLEEIVSRRTAALQDALEKLRKRERELERAIDELRKLSELKSDFISTVSHELRTPLTAIQGVISNIRAGVAGKLNKTLAEYMDIADRHARRLSTLINDLLDISKLEAKKVALKRRELDIVPLIEKVAESFKQEIEAKTLTLTIKTRPNLPAVFAEAQKIEQVLENLLSNAVKFTPEDGKITISAHEEDDSVSVEVRDTGVGIPPEELPKIFDRFHQVARTAGPGLKGTGLGLAIVKEIVNLHGGRLAVKSTPGKGSRFSFSIPKFDQEKMFLATLDGRIGQAEKAGSHLSLLLIKTAQMSGEETSPKGEETGKGRESLIASVKEELRRATDVLVKIEKGEILAIIVDVDREGAKAVERRLKSRLGKVPGSGGEATVVVATYPEDGKNAVELIEQARAKLKKVLRKDG